MSKETAAVQEVDLLISAGCIVTMNPQRQIFLNGAIAINGADIVAVGDIHAQYRGRKTIHAPRGLLTPGLIDVHNHPIDYLNRGWCDDLPQLQRLRERVIPYEDHITEEEAYASSMATFFEMIRHGTTCFMDGAAPRPSGVARAALDIGIRGVVTSKSADLPGPFGGVVETLRRSIALADDTFEKFHGAGRGRLRVCYDLDHPPVVSDELAKTVRDHALERGVGIVGHLIGRRPEGNIEKFRNPEIARYAALGLLGPHMTLAHIGWIPDADVQLLAASGTNIAHCPSASLLGGNGWVSHGVIPDLVAAGANVALGSDAAAISRFLDMVRIMHIASCAHKDARRDPEIMSAYQVFEMATLGGANAMRWDDRIGSLEPGKAADLVVFDATHWIPNRFGNPISDLVYGSSGSEAQTVVINGAIILEDRQFTTHVDFERLSASVDAAAASTLHRLGIQIAPRWPVSCFPER
jgi:5-methylthioadenosine/S-adenosylhomocysteine deaminase